MQRARLLVLASALIAAVAAAAGLAREQQSGFPSHAIGATLHYLVYLPADYATSGKRYSVVYFLHGLPSSGISYKSVGFVEQALDRAGRPAILVAPQGARWNESDPEYIDHGSGDRWETAIARELPRIIDARYRTIRSRKARGLVGLSAGGFGAMQNCRPRVRACDACHSSSLSTSATGTRGSPRRIGS